MDDTVTTYNKLVEGHRRNMLFVALAMILFTIVIITSALVPDQARYPPSVGDAMREEYCGGMIPMFLIPYAVLTMVVYVKRDETAAMLGCFLSWVVPVYVAEENLRPWFEAMLVTPVLVITVLVLRMLWFDFMLAKHEPRPPHLEPEHPPRLNVYR